jgi:hypothetical protein
MSGSSHRDESPYADAGSASLVATPPLTSSSTSPSTVAMSAQPSQQPSAGSFPTQNVSVATSDALITNLEQFHDSGFETQKPVVAEELAGPGPSQFESQLDAVIDVRDVEHRRTDHDRLGSPAGGKSPAAQAREPEATEQPSAAEQGMSEADRLAARQAAVMERLQADVGPLYLLCNRRKTPSTPHCPHSSSLLAPI